MEPTLDFSKPNEAYKFLFGNDLSERQKEHIAKLCAIYQIRPDNVDILRDVVNSGYIEQTERILHHMNNVAKNISISSMAIEHAIRNYENMSTSFLFRLDEKNNEHYAVIDEKHSVFVNKIKAQSVVAAKYFWGAISKNMTEYERISLNEINKNMNQAINKNLSSAFDKIKQESRSHLITVMVSSGVTASVMMLAWYVFLRP
jgi:hypothetical protein